jgi:hypothetical protein
MRSPCLLIRRACRGQSRILDPLWSRVRHFTACGRRRAMIRSISALSDRFEGVGDFDAEAIIREIQAGAERGRLVASLRPTWPQLGEELWKVHDAAQRVFFPGEARRSIVAEASNFVAFSPDSPCAHDVRASHTSKANPRNELVLRLVRMYVGGLINHLGGLAALLSAEVSARPAVAIGRVVLDAGAHCTYLLDFVGDHERSLRGANLQLAMLRAEIADIVEGSGKETDQALEPLRLEVAGLIEAGLADGFNQAISKRGEPQNSFIPGTPAIEQLFKSLDNPDLFRDGWRLASSVVHVQERRLMEFYLGSGDISQSVHGRSYVALQLMPSILFAKSAFERSGTYLGQKDALITSTIDEALQWWLAAGGMYDEQLLDEHQGPS